MSWIFHRENRRFSLRKQSIYITKNGNAFTFSRCGILGEKLYLDTPIRFTHQQWQEAIDRGLGSHATSIVTRTRALLGTYISQVEQEYGSIYLAPDAQKQKCERIKKAQTELKNFESKERNVDPSNFQNGPLQEQLFKADIQRLLFNLRKNLVSIDRNTNSAMLGRADQIVADAIETVSRFNWPFANNNPIAIEKNTRRKKISRQDQLEMPDGGLYHTQHEFKEGLSSETLHRVLNVLYFKDPELKNEATLNFKSNINALGETRNLPLKIVQLILVIPIFVFSPLITQVNAALDKIDQINDQTKNTLANLLKKSVKAIKTTSIGSLLTLFIKEPYEILWSLFESKRPSSTRLALPHETVIQQTVSNEHAKRIAKSMIIQPGDIYQQVKEAIHPLNPENSKHHHNLLSELLEKKVLWALYRQGKLSVTSLTNKDKKILAKKLAPFYHLDLLSPHSTRPIIPEKSAGKLFARTGFTGTIHDSIEPIFQALEELNIKEPIVGSATTVLWGLGGLYLGAKAIIKITPLLAGPLWIKALTILEKIPGISTTLRSFLSGPMPISPVSTLQDVLARITSGMLSTATMHSKFQLDSLSKSEPSPDIHSELSDLITLLSHQTILDKKEVKKLLTLIPTLNNTTNTVNIKEFLSNRYPECLQCYGGRKAEDSSDEEWNNGLDEALRACYLTDLLRLRSTHPNAWVLLSQYPVILQSLSAQSAESINSIHISQKKPSYWRSSIIITPFKAVHGLLGGLFVGLPARFYYSMRHKLFPPTFQYFSGYNHLLGLLEGMPYLINDTIRITVSMNNMFILSKARIYDKARNTPQNLKNIPGFALAFIITIPLIFFDAFIAIPSLLWNAFVGFTRFISGKPQHPVHYLYKLPFIGIYIEFLKERSFEERATRRIIKNNQDMHEFIGKTRSIATARASDISSYRKSHLEITALTPEPIDPHKMINLTDLKQALSDYHATKPMLSAESYIMANISKIIQSKHDVMQIPEVYLLKFIFPEETQQLENQFKLFNLRQYEEEKENLTQLTKQCGQTVHALLNGLLRQELVASKNSKTYDALVGIQSSNNENLSTKKLFEHLQIKKAHKTNNLPQPSQSHPIFRSSDPNKTSSSKFIQKNIN